MLADVVGRGVELRATAAFLDLLDGRPAALVLEGAPGIGKTTLWLATVEQARRRGFRILVARTAPAESQLSYASLADLLGEVDASVLQDLPQPQRLAIDGVLLRSGGAGPAIDQRATGAALLSIMERLADDTPVLLAIDDVQWVDPSSVAAIAFAVRRLTAPIGVLATVRIEQGAGAVSWLQIPHPGEVQHQQLGPLTLGAMHRMLRERTGRSFARPTMVRIQEVSGGNPFYGLELARATKHGTTGIDGPLPDTLAQLVQSRIEGFDADVQNALLAVAAIVEPTVERAGLAIDADPVRAFRLLEEAEQGGIIAIDGHRLRFSHPLLANGVYAAAAPAHRRRMHRRLAMIVDNPEERARHLARAAVHPDQETVAALDEAALRARSRGATAAAAELLTLAVGVGGDTPERRIRVAQYYFDGGDPERARTILEALATALEPGSVRAEALRLLAVVRLHDDSYLEAAGYLEQALDEVGTDLLLRTQVLIELSFVLVNLGRIPDALQHAEDTVAASERLGNRDLLSKALAGAVMVRFLSGHGLDDHLLQRALDLEDSLVPTPVMFRPTLISSLLLGWTGRLDEARDMMLSIRRRCIERGEESDLMFSAFHYVVVECWRGDLAHARLIAEDTMDRAQQLGTDVPLAIALSTRANVAAYSGQEDQARQSAREALTIFERGSCLAVTVWPMVTLGFLEVSLGSYEAAAAAILGPLAAAATVMGYGEPTAAPFAPDAIEAFIALGRLEEATVLLDQLESNGRRLDRPWALALGARCRSLLLAAGGDLSAALAAVERALSEHERLPMPFERARTQLVLGQIHRRLRHKRAAAQALQEATRVFDDLGTTLWSARGRAELARVNVHPAGTAELTPRNSRHRNGGWPSWPLRG